MNRKAPNKLGKTGENIATRYLINKGYKILHRNWFFNKKEIDIVAQKNNLLVIVEVKARTDDGFEKPGDLVDKRKENFLVEATDAYIREFEVDMEVQFDVIFVFFHSEKPVIEHIESAFYPTI
ncbi:MAG: YraN family protein [Bacteroidales bacterium]|nr:YraN family protein [Bacteroidales bacterium]